MKKKIFLSLSLFSLAVLLGLGAACASKPDDAKISTDIQSRLSQDSGLSNKQVSVEAKDGTVTLAGTVDNDAQRDAAARQAASVPGVKQVINNLQVGMAAATPARAREAAPASRMARTDQPRTSPSKKSRKARAAEDPSSADAPDNSAPAATASNTPPPPPAMSNNTPASAPAPPPPPRKIVIDQGTQLSVRLVDSIDSEKNQAGQTFHATLNNPLTADGEEVVPAGSDVAGHLVDVKSAGKFKGQSVVVLQLDSITSGGRTYNIQTDQYKKEGSSRGKNTAEKVGGGAAIGAIIGAIAGGGKGAAIGAGAGAAAGAGAQTVMKGQQVKIPSETVLTFTTQKPVQLP